MTIDRYAHWRRTVVPLLLTVFDLPGTFAFAISGAIAAARQKLDIFGVLVLSYAAATF